MEGKGALFKRFGDIDAIDLLVDSEDVGVFINCVRYLAPSFGGINLEDIKAPDCFIIEQKLKELLEKDYLVKAEVLVFIDEYHPRQVSVIGEVNKPGKFDITGEKELTLMQAIAMAEGFSKHAEVTKTRVMRVENGEKKTIDQAGGTISRISPHLFITHYFFLIRRVLKDFRTFSRFQLADWIQVSAGRRSTSAIQRISVTSSTSRPSLSAISRSDRLLDCLRATVPS